MLGRCMSAILTKPHNGAEGSPTSSERAPNPCTQLQGSWRETGSAQQIPFQDCATNKFREPVAISSTEPADFPLARTALELGFDLISLRAPCKQERSRTAPFDARGLPECFVQI